MEIRFAKEEELERVNVLRRQVNDLHAQGAPEIFKAGFPDELRDYIYAVYFDPSKKIVVCDDAGAIRGYAVLSRIVKPETPFMRERDFLDIDEFGVDASCRRQGIGTRMIGFIREFAKREGVERVELNMWEFNQDALAFYKSVGFVTYRRFMKLK